MLFRSFLHAALLCLFALCSAQGRGQYLMLHYTIEQGLPSNTIYDVYKDKDGMLWIGTNKGVARYNGIEFKTFTTADGLADNECFYFRPDSYGRLWIGTFNGELCYYQYGRFHNARNTPFLRHKLNVSNTVDIAVHPDSSVTFIFKDNTGFVEIKGDTLKTFVPKVMTDRISSSLIHLKKMVNGFYEFTYARERVVTDKNFSIRSVQRYSDIFLQEYIEHNEAKTGYYLGENSRIYTTSLTPVLFRAASLVQGARILRFQNDHDWECVGSSNGAYFDSIPLLKGKTVNDICKDQQGNFWLSTNKDGIYILGRRFGQTAYWPEAYKGEVVFASYRDSFLHYAEKDKSLYRLKTSPGGEKPEPIARPADYKGSATDNILSGWVWGNSFFAFNYTGVYRVDNIRSQHAGKVKMLKNDPRNTYYINQVNVRNDIVYLKSRKLLLSGRISTIFEGKDSLNISPVRLYDANKAVYGAAFDQYGRYWFSARENMYCVRDTASVKSTLFPSVGFREFVFCRDYFVGFTQTNELLVSRTYSSASPSFDTIRSNDCIWDKFFPLNDSVILIGTNNYFRILTLHHGTTKAAYTIRLLEHPLVPYIPDFTCTDSTTCFFFNDGSVSSFPVADILAEPKAPRIQFQDLSAAGKAHFIGQEITLDYYEAKNMSIAFTPISYGHKNLSYEYAVRKEGEGIQWNSIGGNEINLYRTGYGKFTISVRARTMSGTYGSTSSFVLHVSKPFWATYWFIGVGIPVLVFIIAFVARIGIRQALRRKEKEVRFLRSEYKALNALMNPHFIFNSLNSLQSLVNNNENRTASRYIRIFSDLIRQNMRNISQDLIPLSKEMDLVENYLRIEQLRFKEHLNYRIDIDESVETDLIMIPPLLVQPLVENAIKHGIWPLRSQEGFVSVSVYEEQTKVYIAIVDNGAGFQAQNPSDTLHESYAVSNIHKRIEQLRQMHGIHIAVSIEEYTDGAGKVSGVKSVITIDEAGARPR